VEAKLLAAQNRQRAGVFEEQKKIRDAEAAENAANEERFITPLPADSISINDHSKQGQNIDTVIGVPTDAQGT
jgi:hypothetical protein